MDSTTKVKNNKLLPNVHPTNSLILPDGKIFKVQKKRQRKIYSCIPCHQRKIRCSRESPTCRNCLKLADKNPDEKQEILEACKYFDNDKKKNLKIKGVELSDLKNSNLLSDRDKIDQAIESLEYQFQINNDANMANNGGFLYNSNTPQYHNEQTPPDNSNNTTTASDINVINDANTRPLSDEFVYIPRKDTIDPIPITDSNEPTVSPLQFSECTEDDTYDSYSKEFIKSFASAISELPSRKRCDELLEIFQINIHSLLPILDMKSFLEKYNEFWYCGLFLSDNIEKLYQYQFYYKGQKSIPEKFRPFLYYYTRTNNSLTIENISEFFILLYAVFYTAISSSVYEFLSEKYENLNNIKSYKDEVNKYYNVYKQVNHGGLNNPRVMSLPVLQINVLVQSIVNLKSGRSLISVSKILRICQFYQLHRDPVLFHSLKDPDLVQTRRLVWWQIFFLDNLVSFFLNLPPSIKLTDFDTSLLTENLETDSNKTLNLNVKLSTMYLNCLFRFILVVDDLNGLTNGLNAQLKKEDINKIKNNINSLFITCNLTKKKLHNLYIRSSFKENTPSTDSGLNINSEPTSNSTSVNDTSSEQSPLDDDFNPLLNSTPQNIETVSLDCYKFYMASLSISSDKILIMFQKKIIINPHLKENISIPNPSANPNLNLKLTKTEYTYTDLQGNLLPSLLHYLDTFLLLGKKNMLKFNWKLKNYIPIDELILLMQILTINLLDGMSQKEPNNALCDINLKIYLVDQTLNSLKLNWHLKLSSVNKLIFLASNLWELMILKFDLDLKLSYSMSDKFIVPKPVNITHQTHRNININKQQFDSVNCAEVAPRSMNIASASDAPYYFNTSPNGMDFLNNTQSLFEKIDTSGQIEGLQTHEMNVDLKDHFVKVAKLVEDELLMECTQSIIQENDDDEQDEGWLGLGTEQLAGDTSIDDFHFYKNLKNDVIRLFRLIVS